MREIVMYGQLPGTVEWIQMILWSAAVYALGLVVFRRNRNRVMQKI